MSMLAGIRGILKGFRAWAKRKEINLPKFWFSNDAEKIDASEFNTGFDFGDDDVNTNELLKKRQKAVAGAGNGDNELASTKDIQDDTKAYELYKNSLDALVKSGIDIKPLTVKTIFNQVKPTDKGLWNIAFTTFLRDVWPRYSKENGLKKQPGRPRTK